MLLPFDQSNPKVRAIVTIATVALVSCALWMVYRAIVPSGGESGITKDFPTSTGFVLAEILAEQIGTGGIIVIVNATHDANGAIVRTKLGESQMAGVNAALRGHSGITVIDEVDLPPPMMAAQPGMLNLVLPNDLAQIIASHPEADGILLLAGLPGVIPRLGSSAPPIVAFDPTGAVVEAWIRGNAATAVGIWNYSDEPQIPTGDIDSRALPFYKQGILITSENIDSLNATP